MLPLIQGSIDLLGIFFVVLVMGIMAVAASAIIMRSIGLVSLE
jgi:hypothetical protein